MHRLIPGPENRSQRILTQTFTNFVTGPNTGAPACPRPGFVADAHTEEATRANVIARIGRAAYDEAAMTT